jgi:hypothetical protein
MLGRIDFSTANNWEEDLAPFSLAFYSTRLRGAKRSSYKDAWNKVMEFLT